MRMRLHAPQRIFAFLHSLFPMSRTCVQHAGWGGHFVALVRVVVAVKLPLLYTDALPCTNTHTLLSGCNPIIKPLGIHGQVMVAVAPFVSPERCFSVCAVVFVYIMFSGLHLCRCMFSPSPSSLPCHCFSTLDVPLLRFYHPCFRSLCFVSFCSPSVAHALVCRSVLYCMTGLPPCVVVIGSAAAVHPRVAAPS